jgi:hypothetical protein
MSSGQTNNAGAFGGAVAKRRRRGIGMLGLCAILVLIYIVMVCLNPWAVHMGGGWTPFLYWTGTGRLVTSSGSYPLIVCLYPSSHSSRLHLDGLRPISGLGGQGWLCTPHGNIHLTLSGTIFGRWRSTDGALMEFRLLEWRRARDRLLGTNLNRGYFDLLGYWRGPKLVMNDRGEWSRPFRSGLKIKNASVTLKSGSKSEFNVACAATSASR